MKKSIKTLTVALLSLGLLAGCNNGGGESSSPASSGSDASSAPTTAPTSAPTSEGSSSAPTSTSVAPVGPTFEETLELLVQKEAAKKGKLHLEGYRDTEYLGPDAVVYTYLGEYAGNGTVYYFVNEQGYFCYQYVDETLNLKDKDLDPEIDLYYDVLYTSFDVLDAAIADNLELVEETEEAFVADFVLDSDYKAYFSALIGYGASYGDYVTAAELTIAKDASRIDFAVTFDGELEEATLTEFGTYDNPEAREFIENIPPYEPVVAWPAEEIAAAFAAKGATLYEIPALEGEGFSYEVSTAYSSFVDITVVGAGADELATYTDILETAGWEVTAGSYSYTAKKAFEDGIAKIIFANSSYYGFYIDPYYEMEPLPLYDWPAEDLAAAFVTAEETAFEVPALEGEGFSYVFSDAYIADYKIALITVSGVTADDATAYAAAFETAGWEVTGSNNSYTAEKTVATGVQVVEFSFSSTANNIKIYVHLALDPLPAPEWPTADIATFLGEEVTDVLPAYEGADAYQFFEGEDYCAVLVTLADDAVVADAIAAFNASLETAEFLAFMSNSYGKVYSSTNNQFVVIAYEYSEHAFCVEISAPSPVVSKLPLEDANEFLDEYGFGFALTEDMFAELGIEWYAVAYGTYAGGYAYMQITVNGDVAEALETAMAEALAEGGFTYNSSYGLYLNSSYSEVEFSYDDVVNTTTVFFGE